MPQRVVFFGNSQNVFSERFYNELQKTDCRIVALIDIPDAAGASTNPSANTARVDFVAESGQLGIPALAPASPNQPEVVETLRSLQPDLMLAVGYTKLLKAELLSLPRLVSANVHASLLPAYRGKHPVFWALRHGEPYSGLTIHAMDAHLDTGDILYQVTVQTRPGDSVATLYERIIEAGLPLVSRLIEDAERGELPRTKQSPEDGSYFSGTTEEDFRIDWSRPAEEQQRWIMATPGQCFVELCGRRIYFHDAEVVPGHSGSPSGTLVNMGHPGCTVATSDGSLRLHRIRNEKLGETTMADFCRDVGWSAGDVAR